MRGNGWLRPPNAAQAILASAALLASAIGVPVIAQEHVRALDRAGPPVETAFAMPRTGILAGHGFWRGFQDNAPRPDNSGEVGLAHPLSAADAARIRQIFALQQAGRFDQADRATRALRDETLLGDILADRYLSPGAAPDPSALRQWLKRWPDLPDAAAIRHLLSDRSRGRVTAPPALSANLLITERPEAPPPEEADPAEQAFRRNPLLDRTIAARLARGSKGAASALRLVAATRFVDPLYAAMLRAEIARDLFTMGDDRQALRTAREAAIQSDGRIGLANFIAGLASWRMGQTAMAQAFFEQASRGTLTAASVRSAASFWAARAHLKLQDPAGWRVWLQRAAASPHTFYGILAARTLDQAAPRNPVATAADSTALQAGTPVLGEIDVEAVAATSEGKRAFALLQVGQPRRAEMALRQLWPRVQADAALCRSIALVAQAAGMTELASQLATILQSRDGQPLDTARFPMPALRPRSGFIVNPALVYALTRLESNFDSKAVSGAGAHGLMQIMPVTASFVMGGKTEHRKHPIRESARALHNPAINLEIGQRYLAYLAGQDSINGNLIFMLASYNAGPNALARWVQDGGLKDDSLKNGDPLLFIEALPARETRDFVHRALSYLWIYDARMHQPAPSLDTLAQGGWPRFDEEQKLASTAEQTRNAPTRM